MKKMPKRFLMLLPAMAVLLCFLFAFTRLDRARSDEHIGQLTEALRRGAVACYAQEGFYPPDVEFLLAYSGVRYDSDRYWIHYEIFASNLMPDITVVEKNYEE